MKEVWFHPRRMWGLLGEPVQKQQIHRNVPSAGTGHPQAPGGMESRRNHLAPHQGGHGVGQHCFNKSAGAHVSTT